MWIKAGEVIELPQVGEWSRPEDVEAYAVACIEAVKLRGWCFVWDRAVRRLGCCDARKRQISLSRYFVEYYLPRDCEKIRRTILHEVAHGLAVMHHRELGHCGWWAFYCHLLGIPGEKARCKCDDFAPASKRRASGYVLCHRDTGEVFRRYRSKPRRSPEALARVYIRGRKEETLGKLVVRKEETEEL